MEKSTKILIGVGVVGIIGLLVYKKVKATPSVTNTGGVSKKPTIKPTIPASPIIDPKTGKLTPPAGTNDTTDPNTNPKFDTGSGGGSGSGTKGGGGSPLVNRPDLNSGKFNKFDPNKKDENWIKALQKKQQKGGDSKKGKKPIPKVDCSANPYDPTCQKVKDCYYNSNDPECSYGEYDYGDDTYSYAGYDNNKYDYSYDDGGYDAGYDYSGGGGYYGGAEYEGGYFGGGYFYSGNYGYSYSGGGTGGGTGGKGGNPSDYYY